MNLKRFFDLFFSFIGLIFVFPFLLIILILSSLDTFSFGLFFQKRVGQYGKSFLIIKIKTFKNNKVTTFGNFLRKTKIDELPQLLNIINGDMSFVGPRPDVEGYYDQLEGEYSKLKLLKPGLTSHAAIKYKNEDLLLEYQENPEAYNKEVIFPDKLKMNLDYYYNNSISQDLKIIWKTLIS